RRRNDDTVDPAVEGPEPESPMDTAQLAHPCRDLVTVAADLHFAHQGLGACRLTAERDADLLSHRTARTVAADEITRTQPFAVCEVDGHTLVVLLDALDLAPPSDVRAQFDCMVFQQLHENRLRDAQHVCMRGVRFFRRGLVDGCEHAGWRPPSSVLEDPFEQPAHGKQFDRSEERRVGKEGGTWCATYSQ